MVSRVVLTPKKGADMRARDADMSSHMAINTLLLLLATTCRAMLTPRRQAVLQARWQEECALDLANASYEFVIPEIEPQFCTAS